MLDKCDKNWSAANDKLAKLIQILKEFFDLHQVFDEELKEAVQGADATLLNKIKEVSDRLKGIHKEGEGVDGEKLKLK